jgi:hypothetical protein
MDVLFTLVFNYSLGLLLTITLWIVLHKCWNYLRDDPDDFPSPADDVHYKRRPVSDLSLRMVMLSKLHEAGRIGHADRSEVEEELCMGYLNEFVLLPRKMFCEGVEPSTSALSGPRSTN